MRTRSCENDETAVHEGKRGGVWGPKAGGCARQSQVMDVLVDPLSELVSGRATWVMQKWARLELLAVTGGTVSVSDITTNPNHLV